MAGFVALLIMGIIATILGFWAANKERKEYNKK
jgi:hypothetical protein